MDLFLGKGGTKKYLNGKNPYWEMWDDINEALKPHLSKMKLTVDDMAERIKEKYKSEKIEIHIDTLQVLQYPLKELR